MSKDEAARCLENFQKPDPALEVQKMENGYGSLVGPFIIKTQEAYLDLQQERYDELKRKIIDQWDEVQEVAQEVPTSDEIRQLLKKVGGATNPSELGLTDDDIGKAIEYAQYVRKPFTILNLSQLLGFRPEV